MNRLERSGRNEVLFREVNERIREVNAGFEVSSEEVEFLCECAEQECEARVLASMQEYESVRARPTHFILQKQHDAPSIERVVRETDRYVVVEKRLGEAADLATRRDPRR